MEESVKVNPLATEKIERLILKFSIPAIISMLVSSLYNIVDQFFIGQRVGENSHDEFVLSRKRICPLCFFYYFDIFAYPIMGYSFEILLTLLLLSNLKGKQ